MVSFQGKYEILSALSDGESQSFRALQISSGRPVTRSPSCRRSNSLPATRFGFIDLQVSSQRIRRRGSEFSRYGRRGWPHLCGDGGCAGMFRPSPMAPVGDRGASGKEGDAQPAAEGTPDLGSIEFTRNFTTEALRQFSRFPVSEPVPPSPGPRAAQPPVPPPEKSPGDLIPPSEIPAASPEDTDHGPTEFTGFWEKYSPANPASTPGTPIPTPPTSPKSSDGPSEVPEVTGGLLSRRSSLSVQDAPTAAMTTLQAQAADRERAPAAVAGPDGDQG